MPTTEQDAWVESTFGIRLADWGDDATSGGGAAEDGTESGRRRRGGGKSGKRKPATPKGPVPRAEIGGVQEDRAGTLLAAMTPADQAEVSKLINGAKGEEKKYLTKALASKHSAAELKAFYAKIAGKDHKWMEDNLHLVGDSNGKGVKQQWESSCVPTMVEAMKGELDPVYALHMRAENPHLTEADDSDATKLNKGLAEDQRKKLAAGGGMPTNRDTHGKGMGFVDILDKEKGSTGVVFKTESIGADTTVDKALTDLDVSLKGGLPVPMRVSNVGTPAQGHAVLCTGVDPGPPRRYSIHDPWNGVTVVVTDDDIKHDKFKIAGWSHLSHIFKPSADN